MKKCIERQYKLLKTKDIHLTYKKERKEANKIMGWHGKKKKERAMCDGVIFNHHQHQTVTLNHH